MGVSLVGWVDCFIELSNISINLFLFGQQPVGKYPVFKELYAEYTWSDVSSLATTTTSNIIVHNRLVTGGCFFLSACVCPYICFFM